MPRAGAELGAGCSCPEQDARALSGMLTPCAGGLRGAGRGGSGSPWQAPTFASREMRGSLTRPSPRQPPGLTSAGLQDAAGDGRPGGGRHGKEREAVVVLGAARLDGPQVAVAPHAKAAGQVQCLHGLRLHLAENRLADGLELVVELVVDLGRAVGEAGGGEMGSSGAGDAQRDFCCPPPRAPTCPTAPATWDPTWPVVKERP